MTSSTSAIYDRHYPDEYVDSALSLDTGVSENRDLPTAREIFRYFVPLKRFRKNDRTKETQPHQAINDINLMDYHFPDEYCDATLFSCDSADTEDVALASHHIVGSLLSFGWLRGTSEDTDTSLNESFSSDLDSSDCDLPDAFIDSTLMQYSSVTNNHVTSSGGDISIDSIASFMDDNKHDTDSLKEDIVEDSDVKIAASPNNIHMISCHLPDGYVDAVMSYDGESITRNDTALPVKNELTSSSSQLDHLNDKISKVLSFKSRNDAVTPNSKTSQRDQMTWEKSMSVHSVDSVESSVPKVKDSRAELSLRKRTPSKSKVSY